VAGVAPQTSEPTNRRQRTTASDAASRTAADARAEHYRRAERALWNHYGLEPKERFVDLEPPGVRLRAQEIGTGRPILFIHGGVWPGAAFAPLIRELSDYRCVVLDRPGCGLSSPLEYTTGAYKAVIAALMTGMLDALEIDATPVVGQEVGAAWALRLALAHPDRVDRLVLTGAAPLMRGQPVPTFLKVLASPIGALIIRLPQSTGQARSILRQEGHGASLDAGRIPEAFLAWHVALMRNTKTMRNERELIRATLGSGGWRPEVTFERSELAQLQQLVLYVYGTNDPESTVDQVRHLVGLLPRAELHLLEGGGHLAWLDDPSQIGARIGRFLAA
jgi:pimeloyl-ACP methyl ester carboxylesterase